MSSEEQHHNPRFATADGILSDIFRGTHEYKYCTLDKVGQCEHSFHQYMEKLPLGYEEGQWTSVHCANLKCHGLFFAELDEKRLGDPRGPRCKVCRQAEMSESELKEAKEFEETERAGAKRLREENPDYGAAKRQRKPSAEKKDERVFAILHSRDEKERLVVAHVVFKNRHAMDVHDSDGYDHLIGLFDKYVQKHGEHGGYGVDDVIECSETVYCITDLVDPVFVDENTST
jgi:hypothetical protein